MAQEIMAHSPNHRQQSKAKGDKTYQNTYRRENEIKQRYRYNISNLFSNASAEKR